ncbi:MAG TPA: IclR family transcriptional regulator [Sporichthyaceae bacterium]
MTADRDQDERQGIQSVENAMAVLVAMEHGGGPMTLTQIGAASGMAPNKAHRYLVSLGRVALVSQDPSTGKYDLGPAMRRLGTEALRRMDTVGIATAHLLGLRDRTGQTVGMHVWGEHGPVLVRWENGNELLPMIVRIGATLPLLSSSAGQVFLAHLPAAMTDPVIRASRRDGLTDLDDAAVGRLKDQVRRDGVAVTVNAVVPGMGVIAAPVLTAEAVQMLVVLVSFPSRKAKPTLMRTLTAELLRTVAAISADVGYVARD